MNEILKYAIENNASDIHITENKIGWVRLRGALEKYEKKIPLEKIDEFIELLIPSVLSAYRDMREKRKINPIDGAIIAKKVTSRNQNSRKKLRKKLQTIDKNTEKCYNVLAWRG